MIKKEFIKEISIKAITFQFAEQKNDKVELSTVALEYGIVLTQDFDLQQDFNGRSENNLKQNNYLPSILICPAYPAHAFKNGEHIENQCMRAFNEKEFSKLKNNDSDRRYHWLSEYSQFYVPELIVDFKHYFTISRDTFYSLMEKNYIATLTTLFRENLSHRFCNYLGRIGLPEVIS